MKVKDILAKLKDIDPEMEVNTTISDECFSGYTLTYGIDPYFGVQTLYEYSDKIFDDEDACKEEIAFMMHIDEDSMEIEEIFKTVRSTKQMVITVKP